MRVHLIHGIHTAGPGPVAELKPLLAAAGLTVADPDYGYILGLETKRINPVIVGCLMPYIDPGDLFICHSNGCAIAYQLMRLGCPAVGAVFINAALVQAIVRPPQVKWIDVYYNQGDTVTEAAKLGEQLGLVDAVWGEMGHAGYTGSDPAITNHNCGGTGGMPVVSGHSEFFSPPLLAAWGPYLVKQLLLHGSAGAPPLAS